MRVSECIEKVRHELAEPSESEWKNAELVSYANDGFAIAWRLASELNHPIVVSIHAPARGATVAGKSPVAAPSWKFISANPLILPA